MEKITTPQFDTPAPVDAAQAGEGAANAAAVQLICPECKLTLSNEGAQFCPLDGSRLTALQGPAIAPDPLLGKLLSERYLVLERLGEGGMGTVYRVRHTALGKQFAVKVLRPELARDAELSQRFIREARAMARVSNPHVIQVTDFGELENGRPFFVMELLSGNSLSSTIRAKRLPTTTAIAIARAVTDALGSAHTAGIVHRDLKPDNINVLEREGEPVQVKVLDFGLAHVVGQSRLTRQGVTFGTPHYMSPEQAAGGDVDHRVDIYALGIVLYEMLAGRVPFEADSYMGVLTKQLYATPAHLGDEIALGGALTELDAIVQRCLQKKPEDRYASMKELGVALAELSTGSAATIPAPAPSPGKHWQVWAALALILLGVCSALLFRTPTRNQEPVRPKVSAAAPERGAAPLAKPPGPIVRPLPAEQPTTATSAKTAATTSPNRSKAVPTKASPPKAPSPSRKAPALGNPDLIDPWSN